MISTTEMAGESCAVPAAACWLTPTPTGSVLLPFCSAMAVCLALFAAAGQKTVCCVVPSVPVLMPCLCGGGGADERAMMGRV
jgi:hypothetical protein